MSWQDPPRADFDNDPRYRWPFWNVEVDEGDLFGDLHERFNTAPMFIQDAEAFHSDVSAIARNSSSKEEFYNRLQQKRDQRLRELHAVIHELDHFRNQGYHSFDKQQRFTHFRLTAFATLDCLVAFLASFLRPDEQGRMPSAKDFSIEFSQALHEAARSEATPVVPSSRPHTPDEAVSAPPHVELQTSPSKGEKRRRFTASAPNKDTERRSKRRRTAETEPVVHGSDVPEEAPVQQTADRKKAKARKSQPNGKRTAEANVKAPRGPISSRQSEDMTTRRRSARLAGQQLNSGKQNTGLG